MIDHLPIYIAVIFGLTTAATCWLFFNSIRHASSAITRNKSGYLLLGMIVWLFVQAALTLIGDYSEEPLPFPPKILLLGILPAMLTLVGLFLFPRGRLFIDSLPLQHLTYLNVVRIPVELVLYWLSIEAVIPELMTFVGRNFDILAGITAPLIAYFGFTRRSLNNSWILLWNVICLLLLINIIVNAFLSAPTPIQQFAFDQPNIAILYFPFSWLPTFVVPIVLFGHLASIRQLWKGMTR